MMNCLRKGASEKQSQFPRRRASAGARDRCLGWPATRVHAATAEIRAKRTQFRVSGRQPCHPGLRSGARTWRAKRSQLAEELQGWSGKCQRNKAQRQARRRDSLAASVQTKPISRVTAAGQLQRTARGERGRSPYLAARAPAGLFPGTEAILAVPNKANCRGPAG